MTKSFGKNDFSRDKVIFLFQDTFEYGKCLETGEMTKSFKYGECLKTWETTKPLNTKSVQKQEKQQNPLNMAIRAWSKMLCAICWGPEGPDKKMLRDSRKASNNLSDV